MPGLEYITKDLRTDMASRAVETAQKRYIERKETLDKQTDDGTAVQLTQGQYRVLRRLPATAMDAAMIGSMTLLKDLLGAADAHWAQRCLELEHRIKVLEARAGVR